MKKLFREFLKELYMYDELEEDFDFYNKKINKKEFEIEFMKFLNMQNSFVFLKNTININENKIDIRIIEHLLFLYDYAKIKKLVIPKVVLIEFLYTYYNFINSLNYEKKNEAIEEFKKIIIEKGLQKEFFKEAIEDIYFFYKTLIEYGIKNNIFIDIEIINRIFLNLSKKIIYYNEFIDYFINKEIKLYSIIGFDKEKGKHVKEYVKYILNSLNNFGGYNYAKEMFFELDRSNVLEEDDYKNIVNKYVNITNNVCNKIINKKDGFIRDLSKINDLKIELNYILGKINLLSNAQKNKIRECLVQILRLKRYIISDNKYVRKDMNEFKNELKIDKNEIEKYRTQIIENEFSLYINSKVDFNKTIGEALEIYSRFPIQSNVATYRIDSKRQIYVREIEKKKNLESDNFRKYFNEKGKEYTTKHHELINKKFGNYYEEMLRYLSKTFIMQQEFVLRILGTEEFRKIINKLKKYLGYKENNDYVTVVKNILTIESNIINIMNEMKINAVEDGFKNINILFEKFKEDKKIMNGLMYLNYVLYEKSGMNLRNDIMHGNLINTNLEIQLLVSFSGLIFVSWLRLNI